MQKIIEIAIKKANDEDVDQLNYQELKNTLINLDYL